MEGQAERGWRVARGMVREGEAETGSDGRKGRGGWKIGRERGSRGGGRC